MCEVEVDLPTQSATQTEFAAAWLALQHDPIHAPLCSTPAVAFFVLLLFAPHLHRGSSGKGLNKTVAIHRARFALRTLLSPAEPEAGEPRAEAVAHPPRHTASRYEAQARSSPVALWRGPRASRANRSGGSRHGSRHGSGSQADCECECRERACGPHRSAPVLQPCGRAAPPLPPRHAFAVFICPSLRVLPTDCPLGRQPVICASALYTTPARSASL